jgi:hypothetical protein
MPKKQLVAEALIDLHRRLSALPSRSHDRRMVMRETAHLYGISEQTLYRALAKRARPRALRRSDRGTPRVLPQDKMEHYCELIAAIKVRTSNKKGRHLSTGEAIRLIEEFGVETPDGLVKAPESTFKKSTDDGFFLRVVGPPGNLPCGTHYAHPRAIEKAGQATRAGVGPAIAKPLRANRSSRQQTPVRARQRRVSRDQRLAPLISIT